MDKVYVVIESEGCTPWCHIVAATTDKKAAEQINAKFEGTEIVVSSDPTIFMHRCWRVHLLKDCSLKSVVDVSDQCRSYQEAEQGQIGGLFDFEYNEPTNKWLHYVYYETYVLAEDSVSAVEIAQQKLKEYLAKGKES